jgi:hypothetical protein
LDREDQGLAYQRADPVGATTDRRVIHRLAPKQLPTQRHVLTSRVLARRESRPGAGEYQDGQIRSDPRYRCCAISQISSV